MATKRRISRTRRRVGSAAGIIAALAIAAPVAQASAVTPGLPAAGLADPAATAAYAALAYPVVGLPAAGVYSKGPTVIGDAFNGGTTVVVSNGYAVGSTNASP
jgi:hypothetical protein